MKLIFVADFFADQVQGGGELNDDEFIKILQKQDNFVKKLNSNLATCEFFEENKDCKFVISNFIGLSEDCKLSLKNKDYVIYEHDHKYLKNRNPGIFQDLLAPKEMLINLDFYQNAKAVFCQSKFHLEIIKKNTGLENLENLSGNLWSDEILEHIRKISKLDKVPEFGIMDSKIPHKNTIEAIRYCEAKKISYSLIKENNYGQFLTDLGTKSGLVFLPKTPETLSRIVVESRMMGLSVKTNKLVGAIGEEWFKLKGEELIDFMKIRKLQIVDKIMDYLK